MFELLDIVDEQNRVIGQAHRQQARAEGLLRRFVHIFICNAEGQVAIQQRSSQVEVYPNLLDVSAGGHVLAGETFDGAATRELMEEIGIQTELTYLFTRQSVSGFSQVYAGQWKGVFQPDDMEVQSVAWVSPEWLDVMVESFPHLCTPALQESWASYQKKFQNVRKAA